MKKQTISQPFVYYGGKQKMSPLIVSLIPPHSSYVEPFFGSGSVFWHKPKSQLETINDHDKRIVNFFRVLQDPVKAKELDRRLYVTPYAREEHSKAEEILEGRVDPVDDIDWAWALFVSISQSFSGILCNTWSYGKSKSSRCSAWVNKVDALLTFVERLRDVQIENDDVVKIIKRYESKDTVYYLDPPYVGANQGHYSGYSEQDLKDMIECIKTTKGYYIISHYPHDAFPKDWRAKNVEVLCTSTYTKGSDNKRTGRTEVLYIVDNRYELGTNPFMIPYDFEE